MSGRIFYAMLLICFAATTSLKANTFYVNVANGNDNDPGTRVSPFKSIAKAIRNTQPGDTVIIVKVDFPIHECIIIYNRSGEPGRPITIDGQNNVFTGTEKLNPQDWPEIRPGIYRNAHLLSDLKPATPAAEATMMRYFMMWGGQMNRMGRSCDGIRAPFVDPANLKPGEWTYAETENVFYIAIKPGQKLEDYHIETPMRQNGIGIAGTCNHWVFRNFKVEHVINDGFNIHGHAEDVMFEHITATECGDDGISAHEDCSITIHGMVSRRNSTGMSHGDYNVTCVADHLVLEENYGYNLEVENGSDSFTDCYISAVIPPGGNGGIRLKNKPLQGSPEHLSVIFRSCEISFSNKPAAKDKAPSFLVDEDVKLSILKDTKIEGKITVLPQHKPQ